MTPATMAIATNGNCHLAVLILCLTLSLVGANAYAQDPVQSSQVLTRWAESAKLHATSVDRKFTTNAEIYPFPQRQGIIGLGVTGSIELKEANSLVRLILVDSQLKEYLVYETYPLISADSSFSFENLCRETCILPSTVPATLRVELVNATVHIESIAVNPAPRVEAKALAATPDVEKRADDVKQLQEAEIIASLNAQIKAQGLNWIAGSTDISQLSYEEKKQLFGGTLPNLQGFEYYRGGVFELDSSAASSRESGSESFHGEAFDWRNQHQANDPNSPYYDGDATGSGWITGVRNQGPCGSCWAFGAIGATEALVNLHFNQHLDRDLAEQDALSCSGAGSCAGGFSIRALEYIRDFGVVDEACFPYSASDAPCTDKCSVPQDLIQINDVTIDWEPIDEESVKRNLVQKGPASISMFNVGVFSAHCVTLVGYSTDPSDGMTVWNFKNSWGNWGENGYGRIKGDPSRFRVAQPGTPIMSGIASYTVSCLDRDGDGYYNWGISSSIPASCNDVPPTKDCNDSDPEVARLDENGNCVPAVLRDLNGFASFDGERTRVTADSPSGCPTGFAGKTTFVKTLKNTTRTRNLSALAIALHQATGGNVLLANGRLIETGDNFSVPSLDDYADGELGPEEEVRVPFTVCLKRNRQFSLAVDVLGFSELRYAHEPIEFRWIRTSRGQSFQLSDDDNIMVPIGFEFEFYERSHDQIYISSNGFLTFFPEGASYYYNTAIPDPNAPNGLIAPFWDDLNPRHRGNVETLLQGGAPNRRLTISWVGIPHYYDFGDATFQVTLYERTGDVVFRYRDVNFGDPGFDMGGSATVGVEDASGTRATQLSFNEPLLRNESALRWYSTERLRFPSHHRLRLFLER